MVAAAFLACSMLVLTAAAAAPGTVFSLQGKGKSAPQITILSPSGGQVVSGTVQWQVGVLRGKVKAVSFSVDGKLVATDGKTPFAYALDTTALADGSHLLQVAGSGASDAVTVTVANHAANATTSAPTSPAASSSSQPSGAPQPKHVYWGGWIGNQLTGAEAPWDTTATAKFESLAGKPLSLLHFSSPFVDGAGKPYPFPTTPFNTIRAHGAIPFFSWNTGSLSLADVVAGRYDGYIKDWATAAKSWGHPFFLRFNWEMNGHWFPWGGNPTLSIAAWKRVHDLFASIGVKDVTWVWCPNVDIDGTLPFSVYYPGDSYVDWVGLDGYNWNTPWRSFDQVFASSYKALATLAPSKPVVVAETASTESGGSKAAWISDALEKVAGGYPSVKAFLWFEKYTGGNWPIETSATATAAFAKGISSPVYASNQFGSVDGGPVPPLP